MGAKINPATPNVFSSAVSISRGNKFHVTAAVTVHKYRWWRSGTQPFPNEVWIYNDTTVSQAARLGPAPFTWVDKGGGWWEADLTANGAAPVNLLTGNSYAVCFYGENVGMLFNYNAALPVVDVPFVFDGAVGGAGNNYQVVTPVASRTYGIDVMSDTTPGASDPQPPAMTNATVNATLGEWLEAGAGNLHQTALPYLSKAGIDTLVTRTAGLVGGSFQSALNALNTTMTGVMNGVKLSLENSLEAARLSLAAGQTALQTGVDALGVGVNSVGVGIETIGTLVTDLGGLLTGVSGKTDGLVQTVTAGGNRTAIPGAGWEQASVYNFQGPAVYTEPADRYVLIITEYGSERRVNIYAGVHFLTQPMWWAPLNQTLVGHYHTFMSLQTELYEPGQRLHGVLVVVPPDCVCTIEGWNYTPPPGE